jgi:RecB family exonuclease
VGWLTGWYNNHSKWFVLPIELEMNFYGRNILVDSIPLTGKIDKVEQFPSNTLSWKIPVALIDYKTGRTKSLNEIKGNTANSEWNYFRQLLFYKIMFDRDTELSRKYEVSDLAIEFVEWKDGKYAYISVDYTPEDIERVENEIREVWSKMNDMEFWRSLLRK